MEKSKPKIILSAAISIDGKIATSYGDSKLSSKNDLIRVHKLRSKEIQLFQYFFSVTFLH